MEPKPGEKLSRTDFESVVRLTPLVSIDIVVRRPDGKILVGRRKNEPARGVFFVVGGRITKNETVAAAFRRLTVQELGLAKDRSEARFLGVFDHIYPTNALHNPEFGTHYVVLGYELVLRENKVDLPTDQHGEYAWFTEAEILAHPEVHENTKAYFRA